MSRIRHPSSDWRGSGPLQTISSQIYSPPELGAINLLTEMRNGLYGGIEEEVERGQLPIAVRSVSVQESHVNLFMDFSCASGLIGNFALLAPTKIQLNNPTFEPNKFISASFRFWTPEKTEELSATATVSVNLAGPDLVAASLNCDSRSTCGTQAMHIRSVRQFREVDSEDREVVLRNAKIAEEFGEIVATGVQRVCDDIRGAL